MELAGPEAVIRRGVPDGHGGTLAMELEVPGGLLRVTDNVRGDPWRWLAYGLAEQRLTESLVRAGWMVVDEVIDETSYVVAQEPGGTTWAIGVAAPDDDLWAYLERDMALEPRAERIAFVDPLDTRSPHDLMEALGAGDG